MESKKRKREFEPRITYHVSGSDRNFDRLLKENSLGEMREVVRKKLGLSQDAIIHLAQIRSGKTIDLEDDDDFEALACAAHSASTVDVQIRTVFSTQETMAPVTSQEPTTLPLVTQPPTVLPKPKKRKQPSMADGQSAPSTDGQPKKKKLKKNEQKKDDSRTKESPVAGSGSLDESAPMVPHIDSVVETETPPGPEASATDAPVKRTKKSKKKVAVVEPEPDPTILDTVEMQPTKARQAKPSDIAPEVVTPVDTDVPSLEKPSKTKTTTTRVKKTTKSDPVVTDDVDQPSPPAQSSAPTAFDHEDRVNENQEEAIKEKISDNSTVNAQSAPAQSNDTSESTAKQKKTKKTESMKEKGTETAPAKAKNTRSKAKLKNEEAKKDATKVSRKSKAPVVQNGKGQDGEVEVKGGDDSNSLHDENMKQAHLTTERQKVSHSPVKSVTCALCQKRTSHRIPDCPMWLSGKSAIQKRLAELQQQPYSDQTSSTISELQSLLHPVQNVQNLSSGNTSKRTQQDSEVIAPRRTRPNRVTFADTIDPLEAVVRGPNYSHLSIDDILNDEREESETEDVVLEEDKEPRRQSGRWSQDSSDDEDDRESMASDANRTPAMQPPAITLHSSSDSNGTVISTLTPMDGKLSAPNETLASTSSGPASEPFAEVSLASAPLPPPRGLSQRMRTRAGEARTGPVPPRLLRSSNAQSPSDKDSEPAKLILVDQPTTTPDHKTLPGRNRRQSIEFVGSPPIWTTLKPDSTPTESTAPIDELVPSTPHTATQSNVTSQPPLFHPSDSQIPFPYSQYQNDNMEPLQTTKTTEDSEDEDEVEAAVNGQMAQSPVGESESAKSVGSYRRLSHIASQPIFTSTPLLRTALSAKTDKLADWYGKNGDASSDSGTESDSEEEKIQSSHIPKLRRAGMFYSQ